MVKREVKKKPKKVAKRASSPFEMTFMDRENYFEGRE